MNCYKKLFSCGPVTTVITIQHLLNFSTGSLSGSAFSIVSPPLQRRSLVINMGGQRFGSQILGGKKFGSQILGGKNFGKIYFQTKNLEKFPFILSKISDDLFLVLDNFFYKIDTFHSKCTRFSLYCCLCFCFLSCFFF